MTRSMPFRRTAGNQKTLALQRTGRIPPPTGDHKGPPNPTSSTLAPTGKVFPRKMKSPMTLAIYILDACI
jgi:hypothetical protein